MVPSMSRPTADAHALVAALHEVANSVIGMSSADEPLDTALWKVKAKDSLVDHLLEALRTWQAPEL